MRFPNCTCEHGYLRYTHGCRCAVCKAAKADYMRERRRDAHRLGLRAGTILPLGGFTHGTRSAYEEHGCRCGPCMTAKRASYRTASKS